MKEEEEGRAGERSRQRMSKRKRIKSIRITSDEERGE